MAVSKNLQKKIVRYAASIVYGSYGRTTAEDAYQSAVGSVEVEHDIDLGRIKPSAATLAAIKRAAAKMGGAKR